MGKSYNNRKMETVSAEARETAFFFPKANPPQTIVAKSREEAEKKLKAKSK